jgi:hypothetical protein
MNVNSVFPVLGLAISSAVPAITPGNAAAPPPNVLMIVADDI